MGVADGVSSWSKYGVDPSLYCEFLNQDENKRNLLEVLERAAQEVEAKGSSTCCLACMDTFQDCLHTLVLGDSGYMILRPENEELKILFKSEDQTHSFNSPYQVGTWGDNPLSAIANKHYIQDKDIVIMATDGLWDNLYETSIVNVLKPFVQGDNFSEKIDQAIKNLADSAYQVAYSQNIQTPFQDKAQNAGLNWRGGKPDDITILLGQIVFDHHDDTSTQADENNNPIYELD
eukprot:TRINITY_DN19328_c0_g1_i2.p1 TRINITY_DN19328_c0_g1~~TRINITY_DN19328_c0_g1_i2.p1  ORF type:complete len:233 (-),score=16.94 TRINITY_DN19328_c0_g1_i2:29-727(-)